MSDPADLLAAVREAVESGSIEGEVVETYRIRGFAPVLDAPNAKDGSYLVIPIPESRDEESQGE